MATVAVNAATAARTTIRRRQRDGLPRFTDRLTLGASEIEVSPFCLGMVSTPDTVLAAYDAGINFFFVTADMHWPLYEAMREGLRRLFARGPELRSRMVVGVVSYATQPEFCWAPFQEVLEAVPGLGHIDVTVAGGAYGHEFGTRREVYAAHREERWVGARAIGATFHDRLAAAAAIREGDIDIAFIRYNPGHPGAQLDVMPHVAPDTKTRVYNFKSTESFVAPARMRALGLHDDFWYPDPTDYYRFALTRPEIDGVLCSPSTPTELHALETALALGPLDDEEERYLIDLARLDANRP
jgi:hypothetical protein